MLGERLGQLVSFEQTKLAAAAILFSPYVPLLFMGEEYGETAPFQFFSSFLDLGLAEAVRRGRQEEFACFRWQGEAPDPQDEATFVRSRLNHSLMSGGRHKLLRDYYRTLIELRTGTPALAFLSKEHMEVQSPKGEPLIVVHRWTNRDAAVLVLHFGEAARSLSLPVPPGLWQKRLDSADPRWSGPGTSLPDRLESHGEVALNLSAQSVLLFTRE